MLPYGLGLWPADPVTVVESCYVMGGTPTGDKGAGAGEGAAAGEEAAGAGGPPPQAGGAGPDPAGEPAQGDTAPAQSPRSEHISQGGLNRRGTSERREPTS